MFSEFTRWLNSLFLSMQLDDSWFSSGGGFRDIVSKAHCVIVWLAPFEKLSLLKDMKSLCAEPSAPSSPQSSPEPLVPSSLKISLRLIWPCSARWELQTAAQEKTQLAVLAGTVDDELRFLQKLTTGFRECLVRPSQPSRQQPPGTAALLTQTTLRAQPRPGGCFMVF